MEEKNDLAKRILTIKKTFDAPVELVWEAWVNPENIVKWWHRMGWVQKLSSTSSKLVENGNTRCTCRTAVNSFLKASTPFGFWFNVIARLNYRLSISLLCARKTFRCAKSEVLSDHGIFPV